YAASGFSLVITDSIVLPSEPSLNAWFPFSTGRVNLSIILMIASKPFLANCARWVSRLSPYRTVILPRKNRQVLGTSLAYGGLPVIIDTLLGQVKLGITHSAIALNPVFIKRATFGRIPSLSARSI